MIDIKTCSIEMHFRAFLAFAMALSSAVPICQVADGTDTDRLFQFSLSADTDPIPIFEERAKYTPHHKLLATNSAAACRAYKDFCKRQ